MATNVNFNAYNLTNQKLSSNQLRELFKFCTSNYGGAVTSADPEDVIGVDSGNLIFKVASLNFIIDGFYLVGVSLNEVSKPFGSDYEIISINIPTSIVNGQTNTIITNDITEEITIENIGLKAVINENENIDIVDSDDQSIVEDYNHSYKTFTYDGYYVIPLAFMKNGNLNVMLGCMSKSKLEDFLTETAYEQLKNWAEGKFVWRIGGPEKGDVGSINITNGTIAGENTSIVFDSSTSASSGNWLELNGSILNRNWTNDGTNDLLKQQAVIVLNDGRVIPGVVPVKAGGTGGATKDIAKTNLGFYIGTATPNDDMGDNGDIYFQILE